MSDSDLPAIRPTPHEPGQPGLIAQLEGFEISAEVEAVANRLIAQHPRLQWLDDWAIGYLLHHTDPPEVGERSPHVLGRARLVPKHFVPFTRVAATVTVNAPIWQVLAERQREALVLHELLHLGTNDHGALIIVPHDVEEFGFVAATYGAWEPGLRDFGLQLQMGLGAGE